LLDGLLNRTELTIGAIEQASGRLDYAIERYESLIGTDAGFAAVLAGLEPVPDELLLRSLTESDADVYDPVYIQTSAGALLNQLEFLGSIEAYSARVHETVVDGLDADAVAANSAVSNTRLFAGAIAIVSLATLLLLAWSTLRPLRRLTNRARDISDGSFDVEPLPERGPRDVRFLTTTMNSMATTLRMVDREIADLASDSPGEHDRNLPGAIGISITRSFDRLEEVSARLQESEQLASAIVEHAADAIWTIDAHGLITSANGASVGLTGVSATRQLGEPLERYLPSTAGEVDIRSESGETLRVLVASSEITSGDQALTTVIAHDISERLRFEQKLAHQANHDALTGLPNRYAVLEALVATPVGDSVSVLFLDLDGFKSVNDTRGHLAGDRVLADVSRRLSSNVRPGDFVGRLGGDEFVVIMRHVEDGDDAISFAHRLIREIEQPYHDGQNLFALSASVGIAVFPHGIAAEGCDALGAIRRADSAVYAAKGKGRGRVEAFDERLQNRIVDEAEIELALRSAVRNDELEMHLQPVFDAVLGRFTSAEALVRWIRPGHGMMPPGQFIPIAERSSLIDEIGRWVL
ncbi:MAG: diguanylate cyclase, partial [Ilumatobacter sp.]